MKKLHPAAQPAPLPETSYQMRLMAAIAISFVVIGHIRYAWFNEMMLPGTFAGWFPYYSFHLPLFLFITGYYFKDFRHEDGFFRSFGKFLLKKAKNFLIPYFVFNGAFLLIGTVLRTWGVSFPQSFTWKAWLIDPWIKMYTITFSVPAWYLIALFFAEIIFVLLRKGVYFCFGVTSAEASRTKERKSQTGADPAKNAQDDAGCRGTDPAQALQITPNGADSPVPANRMRKTGKQRTAHPLAAEIVLVALVLGLGIAAVWFKSTGIPSEAASVYLRSVVMLFFMEVGFFYRKFLEKHDTLPSGWYFLIVFVLQFLVIILSNNNSLGPGLYGLVDFGTTGETFFIGGLIGVALWLRITRVLASTRNQSRLMIFIGNNTKYIMGFHVFGMFLLNAIFLVLHENHLLEVLLFDFNKTYYKSYLYYSCTENPRMILVYFFGAMGFSLLFSLIVGWVKKTAKNLVKKIGKQPQSA